MNFSAKIILVAMTASGVIGRNGELPWHIPEDLRRFRELTTGHTLIMGRRTHTDIGRPLPERRNIVISTTLAPQAGIEVCRSFAAALARAEQRDGRIFFIGGRTIYEQALPVADEMIVSWIREEHRGDVFFPPVDWTCWQAQAVEQHQRFSLVRYRRIKEGTDCYPGVSVP